ncbi:uncharacterized protein LOC118434912 [Folsomia candida]|uniref:uncharacterized protein LOC118434912 n=1 Tax=Folsomia candida TaxID=158441 RepID=UPI0016050F6C|nr:uncharacterized protein LOC118434912 [Folsomia candida]
MADERPPEKAVTVQSQIRIIRIVSFAEIWTSLLILLCQTIAIAASYEFSTRSLTGIWTSFFFFMTAGLALFWSVRCTFNGLLAILVLQIIAATMTIPLLTASCIMLGVYNFVWNPDEYGAKEVGSSTTILTTNIGLMVLAIAEMGLNSYNAYKCYFLAYGGQTQPKENNYDHPSISSSSESVDGGERDDGIAGGMANNVEEETKADPAMPLPLPDLMLGSADVLIFKYIGVAGVIFSLIIFCSQTAMLVLVSNNGIKIGVGVWGAVYFFVTSVIILLSNPTSQRIFFIFILQLVQFVICIIMVSVGLYIVASFGSCIQQTPFDDCTYTQASDLSVTILGGVIVICGMVQGLLSLIIALICSQSVCGVRFMISGATVYPYPIL